MSFSIDSSTYNKPARYPLYHGYAARPSAPTSVVGHSTNNSKTTSFESEANFLYSSPDVSADYLIGKDGRIVRFLDSRRYQAWHAGGQQANGTWTAQPEYANPKSIGIELHKSLPDPFYPKIQLDAFAWLLLQIAAEFHIAPNMIDTHGQIAIAGPYIRKTDPDDWPHADFIQWRDALFAVDPLRATTLPGAPPAHIPVYCSVEAANFYFMSGGLAVCGYPVANEFHDVSLDCYVLICERTINKRSAAFGSEFALLAEARREEWLL